MSNADIGRIASLLKRESKQREKSHAPFYQRYKKGKKCSIKGFHRCQTPTAVNFIFIGDLLKGESKQREIFYA